MAESTRLKDGAHPQKAPPVNLNSPDLYINRELSLLAFQRRVLAQAANPRHPLLERVRFLAIVSINIDEFFMVRVSDLMDEVQSGVMFLGPDAMTPAQQLVAIRKDVQRILKEQRRIYCDELLPQLAANGIRIVGLEELSTKQRAALRTYFEQQIFPVITPLAINRGNPFPHISNLSVNLAAELQGPEETLFARVKIPDVIPRLLHLEAILGEHVAGKSRNYTFVWLDEVVALNLSTLFPGVPVLSSHSFRVVRDADIEIHEEEGVDLRASMEQGLRQRRFGEPVALFVEESMPERVRQFLCERLDLGPDAVYATHRPLGLKSLMELTSIDRPDLKYPRLVPRVPPAVAGGGSLFAVIDRHDVLVYHPYESFAPVVDLLWEAARDPDVLAIKMTLYRVGTDSPVVEALLDAVNRGKQVAVLVELKARFDEESNIEWATELERAGVHVVYGFIGLKTHAKVALVVRKDGEGAIRRYVHVATGNYNPETARGYTDLGLFTADPDFGADATDLFNFLTGYSTQVTYRRFLVAPSDLREALLAKIEREIEIARRGGQGHLIFKVNSLADREFMRALYRASRAGVRVDLIVRGVCSLRPGIPGVSENIRVVSLVGRFLEHSRVYWFGNGGNPEMYLGSADLLPRNLNNRIEVVFPLCKPDARERVYRDVLQAQLRDTVNAWAEQADGTYKPIEPPPGEEPFDSQAWSIEHA
ncbi:MAG TPA: polyphosphate kinase 1 [Chloroflexota bacterium]|nr:polyphosphate kinase 1 [Chloroflexota bacterium]